jgi:ornithine carbamoyltransferase
VKIEGGCIEVNLLDIEKLTEHQIMEIFQLADALRLGEAPYSLKGKTILLFFPESSLRTRVSFEKGIKDLGGESILFPPAALDKREELSDVIRYMENWVDCVVVRHGEYERLVELSRSASIPVINAMTAYNHPCEILSDLYAVSRLRADYKELVYTFVGPAGNISRTWMHIAKVMGLSFHQVCTAGHELGEPGPHYSFNTELEPVLSESDIILTDSLPGGLLTDAYIRQYQITLERMRLAKPGAMLNPCPPFYRNQEVSADSVASPYFVGHGFKKSLLYVQQAVILYCLGNRVLPAG